MKLSRCVVVLMSVLACGSSVLVRGAIQFADDQAPALGNDSARGISRSTPGMTGAPALAFDNRPETTWRASLRAGSQVWIEHEFAGGVRWQLTEYSLTSGTNPSSSDPRAWAVLASNDGVTWVTLDERNTSLIGKRRFVNKFQVAASAPYSRFRVVFKAGSDDRSIEVGEVGLTVRTHALPPNVFSAESERGGVALKWEAADQAEGYTVLRAPEPGGPYTVVASGLKGTSFLDKGPFKESDSSCYAVCAEREGRPGAPSVVASALTPVNAPAGIAVKRGDASVVLEWEPVPRAVAYVVRRSLQMDGPYTTVGTQITAPAFKDEGLAPGTAYHYVVCGVASGKEGVDSAPVSVLFPPSSPANLKIEGGKNSVVLSWDAVALADIYQVLRAENADAPREFFAEVKDVTTFTDTAVSVGKTYYYSVVAVNACGTSQPSSVVSGTPQKPPSWWRR